MESGGCVEAGVGGVRVAEDEEGVYLLPIQASGFVLLACKRALLIK